MAEKKWFVPLVLVVLTLLVITQVVALVLNYQNQEATDAALASLTQKNNQLSSELVRNQEETDAAIAALNTQITQTRDDLDKNILGLQQQLTENQAQFNTKLSALEDNQEKTAQQLQRSIDNIQVANQDFSGVIQDVLPSVVSVLTDEGVGSGAIVTDDGHIITNYHVIEDANIIRVLAYDGEVHAVRVLGADQTRDIAVLQIIGGGSFDGLRFEEDTFVGQNVVAIGNPGGLGFSVSEGIISNNNRVVNGLDFIQISAPINPGNSGGPLIDVNGRIVGINTLKLGGFEGVGFAIPAKDAKDILDQALELEP